MYNTQLYNSFIELLNKIITDHLDYLQKSLKENADFRYGDQNRKIDIINDLIENEKTGHFNHINAKGIDYNGTTPELNLEEINELISYTGVNLENTNFGIFKNKNDKGKAFAYQSLQQLISMTNYSLAIQFYTREKEKITIGFLDYRKDIFFDPKSQKFFEEEIVAKWLFNEKNKKTALSYVFRRMKNYANEENFTPLKIDCRATYFVKEYWNIKYSELIEFENTKNPKLEKVSNAKPYCSKFDELESDFLSKYIKIN